MHPSPPDLSIVIVNWNVRELLRRCLESILGSNSLVVGRTRYATLLDRGERWTAEVTVVDDAWPTTALLCSRQDYPPRCV